MLNEARKALQITTTSFDDDILRLIKAGVKDVKTVGCNFTATVSTSDVVIEDEMAAQAVITYVRCNFGSPDNYDRLKASYDEQKAQLRENSNYNGGSYAWVEYLVTEENNG